LPRPAGARTGRGRAEVPAKWSADLDVHTLYAGSASKQGRGVFHYDRPGRRSRMSFKFAFSYFRPNHTAWQDQLDVALPSGLLSSNTTIGLGAAGVCEPDPPSGESFHDMFSWIGGATPAGRGEVSGEPCDIFRTSDPGRHSGSNYSVCVGTEGLPLEFNRSRHFGGFSGETRLRFSRFRLGSPGDDAFRRSEACEEHFPRPPCADRGVSTIDVYRVYESAEPLALEDRNAGDTLGDLAFICIRGAVAGEADNLVAHWKVNVSHAFGQYARCNFNGTRNSCIGPKAQLTSVGRRGGVGFGGMGDVAGQCSPNLDVGSQFSFPTEARCPPGVTPGASSGCAWGDAVHVRTVRAACLLNERGLMAACAREVGHAPFSEAARIWAAAFASDDPARGGCPEAPASGAIVI